MNQNLSLLFTFQNGIMRQKTIESEKVSTALPKSSAIGKRKGSKGSVESEVKAVVSPESTTPHETPGSPLEKKESNNPAKVTEDCPDGQDDKKEAPETAQSDTPAIGTKETTEITAEGLKTHADPKQEDQPVMPIPDSDSTEVVKDPDQDTNIKMNAQSLEESKVIEPLEVTPVKIFPDEHPKEVKDVIQVSDKLLDKVLERLAAQEEMIESQQAIILDLQTAQQAHEKALEERMLSVINKMVSE